MQYHGSLEKYLYKCDVKRNADYLLIAAPRAKTQDGRYATTLLSAAPCSQFCDKKCPAVNNQLAVKA
jgi:hypothetical protein